MFRHIFSIWFEPSTSHVSILRGGVKKRFLLCAPFTGQSVCTLNGPSDDDKVEEEKWIKHTVAAAASIIYNNSLHTESLVLLQIAWAVGLCGSMSVSIFIHSFSSNCWLFQVYAPENLSQNMNWDHFPAFTLYLSIRRHTHIRTLFISFFLLLLFR